MGGEIKFRCFEIYQRIRSDKAIEGVFLLFTVPQSLSHVRCRNHLPTLSHRVTMQTTRNTKKRSPSLSAQSVGKGWGAFLTTEHTTHTLGTHGNHTFKECPRESGWEQKGLESCQDCQEDFYIALRVQEAAGSNPVTRTKNTVDAMSAVFFGFA